MVADVLEAIGAGADDRAHDRRQRRPGRAGAGRRASAPRWSPTPRTRGHVEAALAGIARAEVEGAELRRPAARRLPAARPARARPPADRRPRALRRRSSPTATATGTNALVLTPARRDRPRLRRGQLRPPRRRRPRGRHPLRGRGAGLARRSTSTPRPTSIALTRELDARPRPRPRAPPRRWGYERGPGEAARSSRSPACRRSSEGMRARRADRRAAPSSSDGDVVVVSQKIVSKAEGRVRTLSSVDARRRSAQAGRGARQGAGAGRADPRGERRGAARRARRPDRRDPPRLRLRQRRHRQLQPARPGHRLPAARGPRRLGPADPGRDRRAAGAGGRRSIVADSFGRAWRLGQAEVAIGCAGLAPLDDWRGRARRAAAASWRRP